MNENKRLYHRLIKYEILSFLVIALYVLLYYLDKIIFNGEFHGFFEFDLYEWLADSFRAGDLGIKSEDRGIILWDSTPRGETYFLTWGPLPALIYLLVDFVSGIVFPKVILFYLLIIFHLFIFYLLCKRLFENNRLIAFLAMISYSATDVFSMMIHMDELTAEISVWYASTFFIFAVYGFAISTLENKWNWLGVFSAVFLVCAMLTRVTYIVHSFLFLGIVLFLPCGKKTKISFFSIIGAGVGILFFYNKIRFGSLFDFGEDFGRYHMSWEQALYGYGFIPQSVSRVLLRFQESFYDLTGLYLGRDAILEKGRYHYDPFTIYSCFDHLHLWVRNPTIIFGFFGGIFFWITKWRKHRFELNLSIIVFGVIGFFLTYSQGWMYRYAPPFFGAFILLGFKGLWDLTKRLNVQRKFSTSIFIILVFSHSYSLWVSEWLFSSGEDMTKYRVAPLVNRSLAKNIFLDREFELIPGRININSIECKDVKKMSQPPKLPTKLQLGLTKKNDSCEMKFFAGATLSIRERAKCRFELDVVSSEIKKCSDINLYLDGEFVGQMNFLTTIKDNRICSYNMRPMNQKRVIIHFKIAQKKYDIDNIYNDLKTYTFKRMAIICEEKI